MVLRRRTTRFRPVMLLALVSTFMLSLLSPAIGPVAADAGASAGETSLEITVHACPDGVDPTQDASSCSSVIDAAPGARLGAWPDHFSPLDTWERTSTGGYLWSWGHTNGLGPLNLMDFAPTNYNYFTFTGLDESWRWGGSVTLAGGEHRQVDVYYYNGSDPLILPAENTAIVTVLDCPAGVDPTVDASSCTEPTASAALGNLRYGYGTFGGAFSELVPAADGSYTFSGLPAYTAFRVSSARETGQPFIVTGEAEELSDDPASARAYLLRNEIRRFTVYRLTVVGAPPDGPGPGDFETPSAGTGVLVVSLRACPAGIDTYEEVSPETCPTGVRDDGTGKVYLSDTTTVLVNQPLNTYPFVDGSYVIDNAMAGRWYISGLESVESDGMLVTAVDIHGSNIGVDVVAGETSYLYVYYVNHD